VTRENQNTGRKICPSVTLPITNATWTSLGLNLGLCGERPATNRLIHSTAKGSFHKNKTSLNTNRLATGQPFISPHCRYSEFKRIAMHWEVQSKQPVVCLHVKKDSYNEITYLKKSNASTFLLSQFRWCYRCCKC
jgi:hypothetical protein